MKSLQDKDYEIEQILGNILLVGVILSALFVLSGGILYLFQHGRATPQYSVFSTGQNSLMELSKVLHGAAALQSLAVIQLGILTLIATPVLRVVFSVVAFLYEKDYLYVIFTLIVLGILLYSLFM
jgi:uncharacterized membrane protein